MRGEEKRILVTGDVTIDTAQRCVYRDGVEQSLRPKAFAVLLELINYGDRVVTKQELVDRLWDGAAISEDVLVQCIVDIRKVLQDDPRKPRYIRTMPKVGYRFIRPVEETGSGESGRPVLPVHAPAPPSQQGAGQDFAKPTTQPVDEPTGKPELTLRDPRRLWKIGAVVGLLLAGALLVSPWASAVRSSIQRPALSIAVLPFANLNGGSDDQYLGDGLARELTTALSQLNGLRVVDVSSSFQFRDAAVDARRIGQQLHVGALLAMNSIWFSRSSANALGVEPSGEFGVSAVETRSMTWRVLVSMTATVLSLAQETNRRPSLEIAMSLGLSPTVMRPETRSVLTSMTLTESLPQLET
jgi:transcriptional activator of cad operon